VPLEYEELTGKIIAAAIEVHKRLGPGFIESIYEKALILELQKQGLKTDHQVNIPVYYDGLEIGNHRLDLLVDEKIIVELKAVETLLDVQFAVVRSYLKALNKQHGLLLNFSRKTLEIKRVLNKEYETPGYIRRN
jgi:GxxExxY protein